MLTDADLEVNVLEFRHRTFQFERLADLADGPYAVFTRTETETERQLRPRLLHLTVVVPLAWVVLDSEADVLRVGRTAATVGNPTEIAAEPSEFEEDGRSWRRAAAGPAGYVYAPAERADALLAAAGRSALGLA